MADWMERRTLWLIDPVVLRCCLLLAALPCLALPCLALPAHEAPSMMDIDGVCHTPPLSRLSGYLAIWLSDYLAICPSVHLSICPSLHLSICPSVSFLGFQVRVQLTTILRFWESNRQHTVQHHSCITKLIRHGCTNGVFHRPFLIRRFDDGEMERLRGTDTRPGGSHLRIVT